jgi:hypothetical protein
MHSFLELKTPKDTVATSLNNKTAFILYQQIQKSSTVTNSKTGNLFLDPEQVPGLKIDMPSDIVYPMKRLIEDKLILHLFYLSYVDRKEIKMNSCFIASPIEKTESIDAIYKSIINISVQNVLQLIEFNPKYNEKSFRDELLINLKQNLPLAQGNYPISFIKLFPEIQDSVKDIPLNPQIKEAILEDIEEELILRNKIVKLGIGLYFPMTTSMMIEKFSIADDFIKKEIAPIYYSVVGKDLEVIQKQEDIYQMEPFHEPTTSFKKERAEILHRVISPYYPENYSGELAIMTVLLFEKFALEYLLQKEETLINEEVEKLRAKFIEPSKSWKDIIQFIGEDAVNEVHPKVWDKLKGDISLVFASWFMPKQEVYVFAPRKISAFLNCIKDMNVQMPDPTWKILAFKNLLETNEDYLRGLFSNKDTIQLYGNLLSKAYVEYFPWYYPIFIYFNYFKNLFFATAKKKIQAEQWELESRNRNRKRDAEKAKIIKYKKFTEEKVMETRRKEVIECMDNFYFKENVIPTRQMLIQKCRLQNSEVLSATLKKFTFQIISIPGEEKNDRQAILYPMDHEWRGKESRLKKILSKKIESLEMSLSADKKIIIPYKLVLNHIIDYNRFHMKEVSEDQLGDL